MSKAFVNEDGPQPDEADALPERTGSHPITPRGWAELRAELDALEKSRSDGRRVRVVRQILETAHVVEPKLEGGRVSFGAAVTLETENGDRIEYELVGPDEADAAKHRISVQSPVARALIGKVEGDSVILRRPKGDIEVTIVKVALS